MISSPDPINYELDKPVVIVLLSTIEVVFSKLRTVNEETMVGLGLAVI